MGGTGGRGAVGCLGPSRQQGSSAQYQGLYREGTGSCGGCVNRRGPVRRSEGWTWEWEAGTEPLSNPAWPLHTHRELAYQIAEQFRVLGKPLGLKDCIIVGGMGTEGPGRLWVGDPPWPQATHPDPPLTLPLQIWWLRPWSSPGNHMWSSPHQGAWLTTSVAPTLLA